MELDAGAKLVVLTDDSRNRCALSDLLRAQGYVVLAPEAAEEVWSALDETVDVVLATLGPESSDLLQRGRQVAPHAIFMVMGAADAGRALVEALRSGAEHHIPMPVDTEALLA